MGLCKQKMREWNERQACRDLSFIEWERSGVEKVGAPGTGLLEAGKAKGHPADWQKVPRTTQRLKI